MLHRTPRFWTFVVLAVVAVVGNAVAAEPETVLLWPDGAPGAKGDAAADCPTLTIYLPEADKAVGTGVVIIPGGGYGGVAINHEGHDIAKWFNSMGIAGFIVDYRHRGKGYGHPAPLQDASRAVQTVRAKAAEFGVGPQRIGIIGFSAGGHLASTVGTHVVPGKPDAEDPIARVSSRPDFMILCYPVIAFDEPYTHKGSQYNLLGKDASAELVQQFSSEKQVTADTPPTFLFQTDEDRVVPAENAVMFYLALRKAGVPAEFHSFRTGHHGLGLAKGTLGTELWPTACEAWLEGLGVLKKGN